MTDYTITGIIPREDDNPDIIAVGQLLARRQDDISLYYDPKILKTNTSICLHPNVNIWSKCKPMDMNIAIFADDVARNTAMGKANYGLKAPPYVNFFQVKNLFFDDNKEYDPMHKWVYMRPYGTENSPYRAGDFRNYNHLAKIPFGDFRIDDKGFDDNDNVWQRGGFLKVTVRFNAIDPITNITLGNLGVQDRYFGIVVETNDGQPDSSHLPTDISYLYHILCKVQDGPGYRRLPISELSVIPDEDTTQMIFPEWFEKAVAIPTPVTTTQLRFYPVTYELKDGNEVNICSIPYLKPVTFAVTAAKYINGDFHATTSDFKNVFVVATLYTNIPDSISGKIYFEKKNSAGVWEIIAERLSQSNFTSVYLDEEKHDVKFGTKYSFSCDLSGYLDLALENVRLAVEYTNPTGYAKQTFNIQYL